MVERAKVGGTCLHVGCIPAKELLETAAVYRHVGRAKPSSASQAGEPTSTGRSRMARKQKVVDTLFNGLRSLLKSRKVTIVRRRRAASAADGSVAVDGGGRQRPPSCRATT